MQFKKITIADKNIIDQFLKSENFFLCDYCFTDLFIWQHTYPTSYCIQNDTLFMRVDAQAEWNELYFVPIGKSSLKEALNLIINDSKKLEIPFILTSVPEKIKNQIETEMPNMFIFEEFREYANYIYLADDLINLKGKKFHSKRNFINRFKQNYENRWSYENITKDNIQEVFQYHLNWCAKYRENDDNEIFLETSAIALALKNYEKLDLKGGVLRLDGNIIAFTIASQSSNDTFTIQIEKAEHTINGAYQMINNEFAKRNFKNIKYVNREEDLDIEGLRKVKLSYKPVMLSKNYNVMLKNNNSTL